MPKASYTSQNDKWLFPDNCSSPIGLRAKLNEMAPSQTRRNSHDTIDQMILRSQKSRTSIHSETPGHVVELYSWLVHHDLLESFSALERQGATVQSLRLLSDQYLKGLGMPLGCRRRLLAAVAQMVGSPDSPAPPQDARSKLDRAENIQTAVRARSAISHSACSTPIHNSDASTYTKHAQEIAELKGKLLLAKMGEPASSGSQRSHGPVRDVYGPIPGDIDSPQVNCSPQPSFLPKTVCRHSDTRQCMQALQFGMNIFW